MKLPYDVIVLDLEINYPNDPTKEEIIELGAVRFNRDGTIDPVPFTALITVSKPLQQEIIELTGITQEEMDSKGRCLIEVMYDFELWATKKTKNIVLGAWGADIPYLQKYLDVNLVQYNFRRKFFEAKSAMTFINALTGKKPSNGLGGMLLAWGLEFDPLYGKQHRALADAYNTAKLLAKVGQDFNIAGLVILDKLEVLGIK